MKSAFLSLFFLLVAYVCMGQGPVEWTFGFKKIDDKTYEIILTATVQHPWHIYSVAMPGLE